MLRDLLKWKKGSKPSLKKFKKLVQISSPSITFTNDLFFFLFFKGKQVHSFPSLDGV